MEMVTAAAAACLAVVSVSMLWQYCREKRRADALALKISNKARRKARRQRQRQSNKEGFQRVPVAPEADEDATIISDAKPSSHRSSNCNSAAVLVPPLRE